ncbi:MAG: hypothetical protein V5A36_04590 [Natronomonas sp.]
MPTLTIQTVRTDSVTFIEGVLSADEPCRVRLDRQFDGTIWPPRTKGQIVGEWDSDGVTIETDAGVTAIGFATPVVTTERPIEIVSSEPLAGNRPTEIDAWIGRIEARVESAESLAVVDDLSAATDAVAAIGGLDAVETLAREIARDRRLAAQIAVVPDELCERLKNVEIPTMEFTVLAGEKQPQSGENRPVSRHSKSKNAHADGLSISPKDPDRYSES